MKTTPLHDIHVALGAKMTPFAGFDMPVHYGSIIDEHHAVRERVGIFDVSHMGEVWATGPRAFDYVQRLVSNDVSKLDDGAALYTVMCREDGGIVDDLLVYRINEETYLLVINAANIDGDLAWMHEQNQIEAPLENRSDETALIAIQGPRSHDIVSSIPGSGLENLPFYRFIRPDPGAFLGCREAIISHTGYTGEKGLEIYCEADKAVTVWEAVMKAGADVGIQPAGLGARDTLRLEAGFCLYGNDITLENNPLEAGLGWLTKLDAGNFVGRDRLAAIKAERPSRRLVAFVMTERGIPRAGCEILNDSGEVIGTVTSGTQSPILGQGIGMGYVPNEPAFTAPGAQISIQVRKRVLKAEVRRPPLHKAREKI